MFAKATDSGATHFYGLHINSKTNVALFEYHPEGLDSGFRTVSVLNFYVADDIYHHVAIAVHGDTFLLYLDGTLFQQTLLSGVLEDGIGKMYFGKVPGSNAVFEGEIHTASFYGSTLSLIDIEMLVGIPSSFHIQPECRCPPSYPIASESFCRDTDGDDSVPRTGSDSVDVSFINDGNEKTFWRSALNSSSVNVTLDLEGLREIILVSVHFVSPIPYAMGIYYSTDGEHFSPRQYFARDCSVFDMMPNEALDSATDVNCLSSGFEYPLSDRSVQFLVLQSGRPNANNINQLNLQVDLQEFSQATHIRIQLLDWHPEQSNEEQYFAIDEILLSGRSCVCNGHGSSCDDSSCVCEHNTEGIHCQQCLPLYNNQLWQRGTVSLANPCQLCECYNHSNACAYNDTINAGMCINCQHNTEGHMCERCTMFYYHPVTVDLDSPLACVQCDCDGAGITDEGDCSRNLGGTDSGNCSCKHNTMGRDCSECLPSFYNLSASNQDGCEPCLCNSSGTVDGSTECDSITGQCICLPGVTERDCSQCDNNYYGFGNKTGCLPCDEECIECNGLGPANCEVS